MGVVSPTQLWLSPEQQNIVGLIGDYYSEAEAVSALRQTGMAGIDAEHLVYGTVPVPVSAPLPPVTIDDAPSYKIASVPVSELSPPVTIDDYPVLRERLNFAAIDKLETQIEWWYMNHSHTVASDGVRDLLEAAVRNLQPTTLQIDPLQQIDIELELAEMGIVSLQPVEAEPLGWVESYEEHPRVVLRRSLTPQQANIVGLIGDYYTEAEAVNALVTYTSMTQADAELLVLGVAPIVPPAETTQIVQPPMELPTPEFLQEYPELLDTLSFQEIEDLETRIERLYMSYPDDVASDAARNLLSKTVLKQKRPGIGDYEVAIDPLAQIDIELELKETLGPRGVPLPEPIPEQVDEPAAIPAADEGSLLPLGIGAIAYVIAAL